MFIHIHICIICNRLIAHIDLSYRCSYFQFIIVILYIYEDGDDSHITHYFNAFRFVIGGDDIKCLTFNSEFYSM